jgi:orotate phosphoribosyltransferase
MGSVAQLKPSSTSDDGNARTRGDVFSDSARVELRDIIRTRSFKTGQFTLSSGQQSNLYFNMKPTMMDAHGAELAARAFISLMDQTDAEYVSGLEMGAVPVIGAMAAIGGVIGRPVKTTFVRKRKKEHGTKEMIEGLGPTESLRGKKVFVIDDVATSGKSILQAIEEVRLAGGIVTDAAALVNRHEGGDELMKAHDVRLHQVFAAAEIAEGYI